MPGRNLLDRTQTLGGDSSFTGLTGGKLTSRPIPFKIQFATPPTGEGDGFVKKDIPIEATMAIDAIVYETASTSGEKIEPQIGLKEPVVPSILWESKDWYFMDVPNYGKGYVEKTKVTIGRDSKLDWLVEKNEKDFEYAKVKEDKQKQFDETFKTKEGEQNYSYEKEIDDLQRKRGRKADKLKKREEKFKEKQDKVKGKYKKVSKKKHELHQENDEIDKKLNPTEGKKPKGWKRLKLKAQKVFNKIALSFKPSEKKFKKKFDNIASKRDKKVSKLTTEFNELNKKINDKREGILSEEDKKVKKEYSLTIPATVEDKKYEKTDVDTLMKDTQYEATHTEDEVKAYNKQKAETKSKADIEKQKADKREELKKDGLSQEDKDKINLDLAKLENPAPASTDPIAMAKELLVELSKEENGFSTLTVEELRSLYYYLTQATLNTTEKMALVKMSIERLTDNEMVNNVFGYEPNQADPKAFFDKYKSILNEIREDKENKAGIEASKKLITEYIDKNVGEGKVGDVVFAEGIDKVVATVKAWIDKQGKLAWFLLDVPYGVFEDLMHLTKATALIIQNPVFKEYRKVTEIMEDVNQIATSHQLQESHVTKMQDYQRRNPTEVPKEIVPGKRESKPDFFKLLDIYPQYYSDAYELHYKLHYLTGENSEKEKKEAAWKFYQKYYQNQGALSMVHFGDASYDSKETFWMKVVQPGFVFNGIHASYMHDDYAATPSEVIGDQAALWFYKNSIEKDTDEKKLDAHNEKLDEPVKGFEEWANTFLVNWPDGKDGELDLMKLTKAYPEIYGAAWELQKVYTDYPDPNAVQRKEAAWEYYVRVYGQRPGLSKQHFGKYYPNEINGVGKAQFLAEVYKTNGADVLRGLPAQYVVDGKVTDPNKVYESLWKNFLKAAGQTALDKIGVQGGLDFFQDAYLDPILKKATPYLIGAGALTVGGLAFAQYKNWGGVNMYGNLFTGDDLTPLAMLGNLKPIELDLINYKPTPSTFGHTTTTRSTTLKFSTKYVNPGFEGMEFANQRYPTPSTTQNQTNIQPGLWNQERKDAPPVFNANLLFNTSKATTFRGKPQSGVTFDSNLGYYFYPRNRANYLTSPTNTPGTPSLLNVAGYQMKDDKFGNDFNLDFLNPLPWINGKTGDEPEVSLANTLKYKDVNSYIGKAPSENVHNFQFGMGTNVQWNKNWSTNFNAKFASLNSFTDNDMQIYSLKTGVTYSNSEIGRGSTLKANTNLGWTFTNDLPVNPNAPVNEQTTFGQSLIWAGSMSYETASGKWLFSLNFQDNLLKDFGSTTMGFRVDGKNLLQIPEVGSFNLYFDLKRMAESNGYPAFFQPTFGLSFLIAPNKKD